MYVYVLDQIKIWPILKWSNYPLAQVKILKWAGPYPNVTLIIHVMCDFVTQPIPLIDTIVTIY